LTGERLVKFRVNPYHPAMIENNSNLPHIVIIGCGFGGLEAATAFAAHPVRVTLIDRSNHHLFQPLLYQVATAGLAAPLISAPIRHVFRKQRNVTTLLGDVREIDVAARCVRFTQPQAAEPFTLHFDHLIVAAGATHSYFGHDDWAQHAPGLKTLQDAMTLRRHILMAFEAAEASDDEARRASLLTFVVIGAGPTGVEMAGTLAEIARHTLPGEFRRINPASARIMLLEGGSRILQAMPASLSARALEQLSALGVDVRLGAKVMHIDAQGVQVQGPVPSSENQAKEVASPDEISASRYQIKSDTVIWAAGVAASALGQQLAHGGVCELDRAGRVLVQPDLSLAQAPWVSVIGDMASVTRQIRDASGQWVSAPVPGVSPAAKQMGRLAAANIVRRIRGQATRPFRYIDYGNLATIGRNAAVVDLALPFGLLGGSLRFSGKLAWLFWLFAHIYFLIGFRNRFIVLADWASAYLSFSRSARVVVEPADTPS
jgi:NADH:ubiquinone reductase (H+-translocating)